MTSTYTTLYYTYQQNVYHVLLTLTIAAALIVLGWFGVRRLFALPIRPYIEGMYLGACSLTYILLIVSFMR